MFPKLSSALVAAVVVAVPLAAGVSSLSLVQTAQAAQAEAVRVRGSIVGFNDDVLTVKTREGRTIEIALPKGSALSGVARAAVTDIKPGDYVGIASLPTDDGGNGALEVVIFPAALKGTGEGSYSWDLEPDSSMTNATVADAVTDVDGRTVTVSYHGNEKTFAIPESTPVVTLTSATEADLKPGAAVFINGEKDGAGAITAQRVVVGNNGVAPPM